MRKLLLRIESQMEKAVTKIGDLESNLNEFKTKARERIENLYSSLKQQARASNGESIVSPSLSEPQYSASTVLRSKNVTLPSDNRIPYQKQLDILKVNVTSTRQI